MWPLFSVCLDLYSFLSCLRLRSSVKFRNSSSSITHSDTRPTPLTLCLRSSVLTLEAVNVPGSVTFLAAVASPDVVRCSNQFRDALPGRTVEGQVVCPPYRIGCPHYLGTVAQLYDYQVLSLYLSTVPPQAWWASDAVPHLTRSHTHPFRRRRTMASSRPPSFTPLSLETPAYTTTTSISPVPSPHSTYTTSPPFPTTHNRKTSSSTVTSTASDNSVAHENKKPALPRNVYTHCGRHTDQYLFGGKGLGDIWKAVTKKE